MTKLLNTGSSGVDTSNTSSHEYSRWSIGGLMPKGLYTRSLLIVILPMLLLQSVVALIFMDRHWEV